MGQTKNSIHYLTAVIQQISLNISKKVEIFSSRTGQTKTHKKKLCIGNLLYETDPVKLDS